MKKGVLILMAMALMSGALPVGLSADEEPARCEPSLATIEQLAAALGVTPCWLAFGCEETHGK